MATPLRKDDPEFNGPESNDREFNDRKFEDQPELIEQDLIEQDSIEQDEITTGDLARAKRPVPVNPTPLGDARGTQVATGPTGVPQAVPQAAPKTAAKVSQISDAAPLFPNEELDGLRARWKTIQAAFVDEPRNAVHQADTLVASAMQRLAEVFADERAKLEKQWDRGDNVSTEDLRVALQRYRTFFERLLSV
jgi:hypothetical protein